jgi:hypothetical protein
MMDDGWDRLKVDGVLTYHMWLVEITRWCSRVEIIACNVSPDLWSAEFLHGTVTTLKDREFHTPLAVELSRGAFN